MSDSKKKVGVSRREFLKQTGVAIGGLTLVSLSASTSCTTGEQPSETSAISNPTTIIPSTSASPTSSTPGAVYPSPPQYPPLMQLPGCDAYVALDRKYSPYHIWVYPTQDNIAIIGATGVFINLAGAVQRFVVREVGTILNAKREDSFCEISSSKIQTDLITPISGTILEVSQCTSTYSSINFDPYAGGWLAKISISDPTELDKLYSPQYYAFLEAPEWTGPEPPMF